jgi:hypothetical protein
MEWLNQMRGADSGSIRIRAGTLRDKTLGAWLGFIRSDCLFNLSKQGQQPSGGPFDLRCEVRGECANVAACILEDDVNGRLVEYSPSQ